MFGYKFRSIDQLYHERFEIFGINPKEILSVNLKSISTVPSTDPRAIFRNYIFTATFAGIVLVVAVVMFNVYQEKTSSKNSETELAKSPIIKGDSIKVSQEKNDELSKNEIMDHKKKSTGVGSNTATIFQDSVILNKKTKSMKNLDSIAVMLLVSSSMTFDSTAQLPTAVLADPVNTSNVLSKDSVIEDKTARAKVVKNKTNQGTFYASRLFWSAENNELYFKGKIKADMNDQNFIADGTVNFLGPIYLLIVNNEQVRLNSTIELSKQKYALKRLNDSEAMQKYGEKGRRGAIEISVVE